MSKLLFLFLRFLKAFRLLGLKLRGKTEDDIHAQRIVSGKAWEEFCDNLKSAGASLMYPGAPRDAFNQAEGLRYLTRLTRGGLEAFVEYFVHGALRCMCVEDDVIVTRNYSLWCGQL